MMRRPALVLGLTLLTGCAHLSSIFAGPAEELADLWDAAQDAFYEEEFARAEELFGRLAREHEKTTEGQEALFYLGVIRIDPRNPDWDPELAEARLADYIALMGDRQTRVYRFPEAITIYQMARQLNLPPDERIEALRPIERIITIEEPNVEAEQNRQLIAEVERLKQQIAERDATIRAQQEELERIRRTLTGPPATPPAQPNQ